MAEWHHTDPFPNSEVKRSRGNDSWGVAPCQNSSMPSLILTKKALVLLLRLFCLTHIPLVEGAVKELK
jgi:hypothetical protein